VGVSAGEGVGVAELPVVVERVEQPYVGITSTVTMQEMGEVLGPLAPRVYAWLADRGISPSGPCFWRYTVIDMANELQVEVGVPVAEPVAGDATVQAGMVPGGRYVAVAHVGHPDTLEQATGDLLEWAAARGLVWDVTEVGGVDRWGARLEEYLNDPDDGVDMDAWTTNLLFRLAQ